MIKKLLLIALITSSAVATIHFDYEPELIDLLNLGKAAQVTDLIKVHNQALKWVYQTIEDHCDKRHILTKSEVAYLEYISGMLADVSNAIGYLPSGMMI